MHCCKNFTCEYLCRCFYGLLWVTSPPLLDLFQNGLCHYNASSLTAHVKSYTNVTSGDLEALKAALYKYGPTAVSIDAAHRSFSFYSNGVYYEPDCSTLFFYTQF